MTEYNTRVKQITDDITMTVSRAKSGASAGEKLEAFLTWYSERLVDPGYGVGIEQPDQGLPGAPPTAGQPLPGQPGSPSHPIAGRPPVAGQPLPGGQPGVDNTLPGAQPGPDQGLPGSQPRPDQGLPGGQPGVDNSLPSWVAQNAKLVAYLVLKDTPCAVPEPKR